MNKIVSKFMFNTRRELIDFLLSSNFDNKYTILEYRYLLLAFQDQFRKIESKNSNLTNRIKERDSKIKIYEDAINKNKEAIEHLRKINAELLKKLKKKKPWYKRLFNI